MMKVVKIGGNVVDNEELLAKFCADFARVEGPKILVHGGGVMASRMQEQLGIKPVMVEGRRVTDAQTLEVVTMVYAGLCNKHIVALLQKEGCNAMGLAGCDGNVIKACKRAPKLLSDGQTTVDYGLVGDVKAGDVNAELLRSLLAEGITPVICPITHDGKGGLLNTNADTISSTISVALNAELVYCFEKNGVLYDRNDSKSVIPVLTPREYEVLKSEGRVADGMIPKLDNAFSALGSGAAGVVIKHASTILDENLGTRLSL